MSRSALDSDESSSEDEDHEKSGDAGGVAKRRGVTVGAFAKLCLSGCEDECAHDSTSERIPSDTAVPAVPVAALPQPESS